MKSWNGAQWVWVWLITALLSCVAVGPGLSQAPKAKTPSLADLHVAVATEDYAKAQSVADALVKEGAAADRQTAMLLYGRILLGQGKTDEAKKYLAQMRGAKVDENGQQLLKVYQAWLDALSGKQEPAIAALQGILKAQAGVESTGDAAETLARIHLMRGEAAPAVAAVNFGQQFLKYQDLKSAYLEALFLRRLNDAKDIGKDPAEIVYRQAESLRQAGKFPEAAAIYERIQKLHPNSEWVHPAGFRIGQCLLAAGRSSQAGKHWQDFLKAAPAGPWRGQAHVGIIDIALEEAFDLPLASQHSALALSSVQAGVDEKAKASWDAAAFDVFLRAGIVAMIEKQYPASADAFNLAKALVGPASRAGPETNTNHGLDLLIAAATARKGILPDDASRSSDQGSLDPASLVLALGAIYNLTNRFEKSQPLFTRVLEGKLRGASPAQRAYAAYGLAFILDASKKPAEARSGYLASLKGYPGGSWHDETLYHLALLIQRSAAADFSNPNPTRQRGPADQKRLPILPVAPPPGPPSPAQRAQAREQDRLAAVELKKQFTKTRSEALPHWDHLVRTFAKSPRVEPALYHAGVLNWEAEKPAEAIQHWSALVQTYPLGDYAGDAHVRLIDLHLEWLLDLPAAEAHTKAALEWLSSAEKVAAFPATSGAAHDPGARPLRDVSYDIYIRAGLIAYLNSKTDEALARFQQAQPLAPPRDYVVISGTIPSGVERLIAAAKAGKKLVPEEVFAGDPKAKLCLQLAGIYYEAEDFERAVGLCDHVLSKLAKATREQRSWAYFMRGRSLHGLLLPMDGLDEFRKAAEESPQASWRPKSLFYMANAIFNHERKTNEAIAVWQLIITQCPGTPEAERAAYYIGFALQAAGETQAAKQAYEAFLKKYPGSVYARPIRTHHLPRLAEIEAEADTNSKPKSKRGS